MALQKCRPEEAHKFGIVSLKPTAYGPLVNGLVEKPAPGTAPTNFYMSGRYVLQPEIFGILESQTPGAGGEVQLTDALIELMETQEITAVRVPRAALSTAARRPASSPPIWRSPWRGRSSPRRSPRSSTATPCRRGPALARGRPDAKGCQEARAAVRFRVAPRHRIGFL